MPTFDIKKNHRVWRKMVKQYLPELAARVFALRSKTYPGSGFHYQMEHQLGNIIAFVNNMNDKITMESAIIDEVLFEDLVRTILVAEEYADVPPGEISSIPERNEDAEKYLQTALPRHIAIPVPLENLTDDALDTYDRVTPDGLKLRARPCKDRETSFEVVKYAVWPAETHLIRIFEMFETVKLADGREATIIEIEKDGSLMVEVCDPSTGAPTQEQVANNDWVFHVDPITLTKYEKG